MAPALAAALAAACGVVDAGDGGPCSRDQDCPAGNACARTGTCVAPSALMSVRLDWTIGGVTPSATTPAPCYGIDHMAVTFAGAGGDEELTYAPVPCFLGGVFYDKMPRSLDEVRLDAVDAGGGVLRTAWGMLAGDPQTQLTLALP